MADEPELNRDLDEDQLVNPKQMELPGESAHHPSNPRPGRLWLKVLKKVGIYTAVLAILTGAGFAGARMYLENNDNDQNPPAAKEQNATQPSDKLNETFESQELGFAIDHPSNWRVEEIERSVIIRSPGLEYQTDDGQTVDGSFIVYIRKGATDIDSEYLGRGISVKPSRQTSYQDPQPGQLENTYITDFGLDGPNNFAYFIVQGVFELDKEDTLGPNYANEPDDFLIGGGFTSDDLEPGLATNPISLEGYQDINEYETGVKIIRSLRLK